MPLEPDDLLPVDEAAEASAVSRRTVFRMIKDGDLAKYRRRGSRKTFVSAGELAVRLGFREFREPYDASPPARG